MPYAEGSRPSAYHMIPVVNLNGVVSVVVGDDLDAVVNRPPHGHARVGRPEVDADHQPVDSHL
jgi:hypothetical protein